MKNHVLNICGLFIGFMLMSLGVVLIVRAEIGIMPWDVFHQGISLLTGITMGQASIVVGYSILIIGCFFKMYPGPGTFANIMSMGIGIDFFMNRIPVTNSLVQSIIMCVFGAIIASLGTAVYLKPKYGAGARDGLIMGMVSKFGIKQGYVRVILEGSVLLIGVLMGGNFGIGTFISLFCIGLFVDVFFKLINYNPKLEKQMNLFDFIKVIKNCYN